MHSDVPACGQKVMPGRRAGRLIAHNKVNGIEESGLRRPAERVCAVNLYIRKSDLFCEQLPQINAHRDFCSKKAPVITFAGMLNPDIPHDTRWRKEEDLRVTNGDGTTRFARKESLKLASEDEGTRGLKRRAKTGECSNKRQCPQNRSSQRMLFLRPLEPDPTRFDRRPLSGSADGRELPANKSAAPPEKT